MLHKQLGLAIVCVGVVIGTSVDCFAGHRHKARRNAAASACCDVDPCANAGYYGSSYGGYSGYGSSGSASYGSYVAPAVQSGCGCSGSSIGYGGGYQQSSVYGAPMYNGNGTSYSNGSYNNGTYNNGSYNGTARQLGNNPGNSGNTNPSTSANANINAGSANTGSVNAGVGAGANVPNPSNLNSGVQANGNVAVPNPPVPRN